MTTQKKRSRRLGTADLQEPPRKSTPPAAVTPSSPKVPQGTRVGCSRSERARDVFGGKRPRCNGAHGAFTLMASPSDTTLLRVELAGVSSLSWTNPNRIALSQLVPGRPESERQCRWPPRTDPSISRGWRPIDSRGW